MGKIIGGGRITLDGVGGAPERWSFDYLSDEVQQVLTTNSMNTGTILLGRTTYEEFARVWPTQEGPLANFLNNTPKIVFSTTLEQADWNGTTIVGADFASHVKELKEKSDKDLRVIGSLSVTRALIAEDLLDELDLLIYPVVVGKGKRLFVDSDISGRFAVAKLTPFANGVVHATYTRV